MALKAFESVVLIVWLLTLVGLVAGVFIGVLFPGGSSAKGAMGAAKAASLWLARRRVWVIVGVLGAGVGLGTTSAYMTNEAPACDKCGRAIYGQGHAGRFVDMLYEGVREITGESSPEPGHPLESRMARAAGLAIILLLAFELIVKLFHEPVQRWRIRSHKGHVVVCGLGRIGRELTKASCSAGERVIVVEKDGTNPAISAAREHGAIVWVGDSTRKSVLRLVRAKSAGSVFFVNGSDENNLEATFNLLNVFLEPNFKRGIARRGFDAERKLPQIALHLDRPELDSMLIHMSRKLDHRAIELKQRYTSELSSKLIRDNALDYVDSMLRRLSSGGVDVRAFNAADRAIKEMFDTAILDRRPLGAGKSDLEFEVAHFVLIGFGDVGQRLALYLAELSHFENLLRSRMTIVYAPEEASAVERFKREHPAMFPTKKIVMEADSNLNEYNPEDENNSWMPDAALDEWGFGVKVAATTKVDRGVRFVCNGGFVLDPAGAASPELINRLIRLSEESTVRPMVFICDADDEDNCSKAVRLRDELDMRLKGKGKMQPKREQAITIFPFVPNRPMLTELTAPEDPSSADLIPFGDCSVSCTSASLMSDPEVPIAKLLYRAYHNHQKTPNEEVLAWEDLLDWERHGNISAARHLSAKRPELKQLQVLMQKVDDTAQGSLEDFKSLQDESLDLLAQMEHNRYLAERLLRGWSFGKKVQPENKKRTSFVHWDILSEIERAKDREQIKVAFVVWESLAKSESTEPEPRELTKSLFGESRMNDQGHSLGGAGHDE